MMSASPEPMTIHVTNDAIADLQRRIRSTRLADDFANDDWSYGVERDWLAGMLHHWAERFDWRAQEAVLNAHPQFTVQIDGLPIHYMHVRAKTAKALPLVLTHGWPWTFWDWHRMIGPLTDPLRHGGTEADGFDLIVPSLPGFAFSTPLRQTGIAPPAIAGLWHKLMHEVLGSDGYVAAGGDWGAFVTMEMAQAQQKGLRAAHLSMPVVPGIDVRSLRREDFAEDELWMAERMEQIAPTVQSHIMVHSRDPQTLAYALEDSPCGLAAWLWERRRNWSDCDGDLLKVFDADFLCTTASLYWFTRSIGTSMRIYAERARLGITRDHQPPARSPVPIGYAIAPRDLMMVPRHMAEERTNVQRWSILPKGGHFLPAERPDLMTAEYRAFFRPVR
jgi:pimeloyl-ACP methyl ester carboxylesterase